MNLNNAMKSSLSIIKKAGLNDTKYKFSKIIRPVVKSVHQNDEFGRRNLKLETEKVRIRSDSTKIEKGYDQIEFAAKMRNFINEKG